MTRLSDLRRGRQLQQRAKRLRLRRSQPRYAGNKLRSEFRAPPVKPRPTQPYLSTAVDISDLL